MDLLEPPSLPRPLAELQEQAEELKPEEELKGGERGRGKRSEDHEKDCEKTRVQIY